jgi:hypothetical protein
LLRARLESGLKLLPRLLEGDRGGAIEFVAQIGLWASHLAGDLAEGDATVAEAAVELLKLAEAGALAVQALPRERWPEELR